MCCFFFKYMSQCRVASGRAKSKKEEESNKWEKYSVFFFCCAMLSSAYHHPQSIVFLIKFSKPFVWCVFDILYRGFFSVYFSIYSVSYYRRDPRERIYLFVWKSDSIDRFHTIWNEKENQYDLMVKSDAITIHYCHQCARILFIFLYVANSNKWAIIKRRGFSGRKWDTPK